MKSLIQLLTIAVAIFTATSVAFSQNNVKISIQGTLKDANGAAVDDGTREITFRLYPSSTGSTSSAIWEETANVQVVGGVYSHKLGSVATLLPSYFDTTLYVGIEVDGNELTPRTELTYAPYTLYTGYAGNGTPSGGMIPFAGPAYNVPDGWLVCDGRALSSSQYPTLYAAIGTAWGDGSTGAGATGSTDFNLPDMRGMFLRGWNDGSSNDPDAASRTASASGGNTGDMVGSFQGDQNKSHNHTMNSAGSHSHSYTDSRFDYGGSGNHLAPSGGSEGNKTDSKTTGTSGAHTHTINNSGGSEARPKNVSVVYIIKI
ncbi:MAG: hypothetical protein CMN32_16095 [Saprospirales bacterium]|nr:hypothetical protein [Saprospirales bacterium]